MDTVEDTARRHYGRLVAWLAAGFRDLSAAEDALQDALMAALTRWPVDGVPKNPQAWLLATARRRIFDALRKRKVADAFAADIRHTLNESEDAAMWSFPDDRLKLMFVCAHPQIDPGLHAPLMLQTVLGLEAARIADAFVVSPAAMSQRLVRGKARITQAGLAFEIPEREDLPQRLGSVLDAIYAAFTCGWNAPPDNAAQALQNEALYLGQVCADLSHGEPEALALLALMRFCLARTGARYGKDGAYVPMDEQATSLWGETQIAAAEALLRQASENSVALGRYQLEAAIQSAHVAIRLHGAPPQIVLSLYRALLTLHPSLGAGCGYAAALLRCAEVDSAKQVLQDLPEARSRLYQPWWAVSAEVHARLGDTAAALKAYDMAEGLCDTPAVRTWLRQRRGRLLS